MDFTSIESLLEYLDSDQKNLVSGANMMSILAQQAIYLETLIKKSIQLHYLNNPYGSAMKSEPLPNGMGYLRSDTWIESVKVSEPKMDGDLVSFEVKFDDLYGDHPSIFGQEDGAVPWLMEVGWSIHWSRPYRIPRLTDYPATHYLSDAVREFNETNEYGFVAQIYWQGKLYYGGEGDYYAT